VSFIYRFDCTALYITCCKWHNMSNFQIIQNRIPLILDGHSLSFAWNTVHCCCWFFEWMKMIELTKNNIFQRPDPESNQIYSKVWYLFRIWIGPQSGISVCEIKWKNKIKWKSDLPTLFFFGLIVIPWTIFNCSPFLFSKRTVEWNSSYSEKSVSIDRTRWAIQNHVSL
jgi:hypothetical protein